MIRLFFTPYRCCLIATTTNCKLQKQGWSQLRNEEETAKLIVAWSARDRFFSPDFWVENMLLWGGGFVEVLSWVMWVTVPPKRQQNYLVSFWNPDFSHKVNRDLTITLIFQMQAPFLGKGLSSHHWSQETFLLYLVGSPTYTSAALALIFLGPTRLQMEFRISLMRRNCNTSSWGGGFLAHSFL